MKIGLILECRPRGTDELVCRHLIGLLHPEALIEVAPLGNKPNLIRQCGDSASALFGRGCDRVIILWDLYPAWRDQKPCRKEDRDAIFTSLHQRETLRLDRVHLICIERELETWLIADRILLENAFPGLKRTDFPNIQRLEKVDPKTILSNYFRRTTGSPYTGSEKQVWDLLKHLNDYRQLKRKCDSFQRLADKLSI